MNCLEGYMKSKAKISIFLIILVGFIGVLCWYLNIYLTPAIDINGIVVECTMKKDDTVIREYNTKHKGWEGYTMTIKIDSAVLLDTDDYITDMYIVIKDFNESFLWYSEEIPDEISIGSNGVVFVEVLDYMIREGLILAEEVESNELSSYSLPGYSSEGFSYSGEQFPIEMRIFALAEEELDFGEGYIVISYYEEKFGKEINRTRRVNIDME